MEASPLMAAHCLLSAVRVQLRSRCFRIRRVWSFGNVQTGNTSKVFVTLTNAKSGNITIANDATKGTGFSVQGLPLPLTLTPGQSFTFTISFSPQSAGSVNGSFVGLNPKNYTNVSIPLSGTGTTAGQLSLSPSSASFGNVTVGSTASKSGALSAVGASVTITSASSSSSEFSSEWHLAADNNSSRPKRALFGCFHPPKQRHSVCYSLVREYRVERYRIPHRKRSFSRAT